MCFFKVFLYSFFVFFFLLLLFFWQPVVFTINAVAGIGQRVLYDSRDKVFRSEMIQACFTYVSLGGGFASGPVGLLSGLNHSPWLLALHLFIGSVYVLGRLLLPYPSPKCIWLMVRFIAVRHSVLPFLFL